MFAGKVFLPSELNDSVSQIDWQKINKAEKKLYEEEILPLNQYIKIEYNATDNVLVTICKQHEELYDAIVTRKSQPIEYIQITCAIHGRSYAIHKEALQEQDPRQNKIYDMLADTDDLADKTYDKSLPKSTRNKYREEAKFGGPQTMHSSNKIKERQIKLIKEAIDQKTTKTNLQKKCHPRTLLVVYYADGKASCFPGDHFNTIEHNALSKYCNDNREKLLDSAFQKVVILNKEYRQYDVVPKSIELWRNMTYSYSDAPTIV